MKIRLKHFRGIWKYILLAIPVAFCALPLIYMVNTAFKPLNEMLRFPPTFFVKNPTLNNFSDLLTALSGTSVPFVRSVFNSLLVSAAVVVLTVIVSSMGAFGLTKHRVPFGKQLFTLIIMALSFSSSVTTIPTYLVIENIGLVNSYWALILPKVAVAYNMFLMKQFCEQMPNALLEAARIDGAGEWHIFFKIAMPMLRPAWATLTVMSFVGVWNDYFTPLIYITDDALRTVPLALQSISTGGLTRAGASAAASFLMIMPTIIIYTLLQKKVISTMAFSGIK
ncbi:MAG: carbohydrate ABC transporter permease [Acutalibacteraceae bacterium]|nr:carbohydrate ABC transporter permease [Acutalibacteraceae bacterium]